MFIKHAKTLIAVLLVTSAYSCTCISPQGPPNDDTDAPADGDSGTTG